MAGKPNDYGKNGIIDFTKFWELMAKRGLKKQFLFDHGMHKATIRKLEQNLNVDCNTLVLICSLLNVQPKQIMDYVPPKGGTD